MTLRTVVTLLACYAIQPVAIAQLTGGTITGTVRDVSQAVVPSAAVHVVEVNTRIIRDTKSDSAGIFLAADLVPGTYRVEVNAEGFEPQAKDGLTLSIGRTLATNFVIAPGHRKETVTVSGEHAAAVESDSSSLDQVLTGKTIQDLPINGRNFMSLLALTTGVQPQPYAGTGPKLFNINGGRESGNSFLVDGMDVNSPSADVVRTLPDLEALSEFQIITGNFSAEYGRAIGGIVNSHIRSGTNTFHGSLFEYFRNDALDARGFFDQARPKYNFNQFGGALGGPIIRNKFFIFGEYQGERIRSGSTVATTIPTPAETTGDFSALLPGTSIFDPSASAPFPGNVIPKNRIDAPSAYMFALFPKPNAQGLFNYVVLDHSPENVDGGNLRADYYVSQLNRISAVMIGSDESKSSDAILGSRLNGTPDLNTTITAQQERTLSLNWTHVFDANRVNEFTAAYLRDRFFGPPSPGMQYEPHLGIPGLNTSPNDPFTTGFPLYFPLGYSSFGAPLGGPFNLVHNIPQISDNYSWIRGRHAFKVGVTLRFRQYNVNQSPVSRGAYIFGPFTTSFLGFGGDSLASALLGYPYETERGTQPPYGERIHEYGAFFQDDFKATTHLTWNLGVRWDLYRPATESHNRMANFDPSTVSLVLAGENGVSASTLDTKYRNFSPHVGFAYQPAADGKVVVRGAYSISYLSLVTQAVGTTVDRLEDNPPFALNSVVLYNPFFPTVRVSDGFPLVPQNPSDPCCGIALYYIPKDQPTPYMEQWNLDLQRMVGGYLVDAAYVGTHGVHLAGSSNLNQALPGTLPAVFRSPISSQLSTVEALLDRENSMYHALQVKVEHRYSQGLYLLAGYTWSHSIDDGSATTVGGLGSSPEPQNSFDWRAERGVSGFDVRHRAVASFIYELPSPRPGAANWLNAVLRNWQINGIFAAQSGMPFTPSLANGPAAINSGVAGAVRPDIIGNPNLTSGQTVNHWFNVSAFVTPGQAGTARFTFGDAGRNILRGPDLVNFDFSAIRSFAVTEKFRVQARAECFNIFNHANFALPNAEVDTPQAGHIIAPGTTTPGRQVQFALKLVF